MRTAVKKPLDHQRRGRVLLSPSSPSSSSSSNPSSKEATLSNELAKEKEKELRTRSPRDAAAEVKKKVEEKKLDLERFYVALCRKLYDDGL